MFETRYGVLHVTKGTTELSQILAAKFTVTAPTYLFPPAHTASVPNSMCSLQAPTSLPAQQGRTGQTLGLPRANAQAGNVHCQVLGNSKELGSGLGPGL